MKVESIKSFLLIVLIGATITLWQRYTSLHKVFMESLDWQYKQLHSRAGQDFKTRYSLIENIESNNNSKALYHLYLFANGDLEYIKKNNLELTPSMQSFSANYKSFINKECANKNIPACVNYGELLIQENNYDSAYQILSIADKTGDLNGTALLVDLFRKKSWSKYSENKAAEYLLKIGK